MGPPCVWPEGWDPQGVLIQLLGSTVALAIPSKPPPRASKIGGLTFGGSTKPPCACPDPAPPVHTHIRAAP